MTVSADVRRPGDRDPRPGAPGEARAPGGRANHPDLPDCRASVLQACTRILTGDTADREPAPAVPELARLHESAADWVRRGGTAEAFHRVVRTAVDESFAAVLAGAPADSAGELLPALRRFVHAHEAVARAVSTGLTRPLSTGSDSPVPALRSLAAAVADGRTEALPPGARIGTTYTVLALAFDQSTGRRCAASDAAPPDPEAPGALHRMRPVLLRDPSILPALGVHGGTLLVPAESAADPADLVAELAAAAEVPVLATAVTAQRTGITGAADTAHELLDLAQRLQYDPGLYRFRDLALEYQLTRPGPARARLAERVAPLYDHPELLDTLLLYIRNRLRRQVTAHILELHRNTVDYRLRRIQELTGCDPVQQTGLWCLQSALVAHDYECGRAVHPSAGSGAPPRAACACATRPPAADPVREDSPEPR
ncbi:PucR family transcriptional regulator [Nocardia sp. CA-290969]|uniref:PucR family transcriptional regulator n=1 Tax=Nocardia sp. CA-290969 TaxID=3239986 RepID=UPI003D941BE1